QVAIDCERFGADGITIHPRPDERHIRYRDIPELKKVVKTEFNIEGNPREENFRKLVVQYKPHQVTLVPDTQGQLTSDHGWDTVKEKSFLQQCCREFQDAGIRVSIFIDPDAEKIKHAKDCGTNRVELYTESYASLFNTDSPRAIAPYITAAQTAMDCELELNAGHDLDRFNLPYFAKQIPGLKEVSIGHALVCDALYLGLENTISIYKRCLL
ncbi:MAG TPA: pyridoxine 5'-phosphate synthase, partial [Chitinophagaceae bacterium]|nr:pyridoxine 5'-phosphate synthase [Chitinophagaceae bacterium]